MKMKFRQWVGVFLAVSILQGLTCAQNATTVMEGEKGKCYLITGAPGWRTGYLSADGLFMGGESSQSNNGFVYDIVRDSFELTKASARIKSWALYAGHNTICRDGQVIEIESRYTGNVESYKKVTVWAAAASLDTIVTMSYELAPNPENPAEQKVFNVPYLVDGKTGKIIKRIEPHWPLMVENVAGYGARVDAASNDATVLAGHSTKPGAFHNWSPVFWDVVADTSFYLGNEEISGGNLTAINNAGTIIGGRARGKLSLIHYDRQNRTYEIEEIPYAPGMGTGDISGISETGVVVHIQQTSGSGLESRDAYVYNMNDKTLVRFEEYLQELYGLKLSIPVGTPLSISDDGRKITGWSLYGSSDVPYLIMLDEDQIFAKPRKLNALQPYGEMKVQLSWTAPMRGQYTLKGYNVYCDGEQINAELIGKAEERFVHEAAPQGVHTYTVKAVYEEGVSDDSDPLNMMVIGGDGCLPVQEMGHHLTYNRGVEVYWGLPSAQMSQPVETAAAFSQPVELVSGGEVAGRSVMSPKSYSNQQLDLVTYKMLNHYTFSSALVIDGRLYGGQYSSNYIKVFDMSDMSVLEAHQPIQVSIINMAYAANKLYLATGREEIVVIDRNTMTQSNTLKTKAGVKVRNIAYIPTLDGGKGGFAYGDWYSLYFCDRYGRELTEGLPAIDITGLSLSGIAYHNGKLYLYSQTGATRAEIYTVDFASGQYVGKRDLADIQRLMDIEPRIGFIAGGLSVSELPDGTVVLGCVMQFSAHNSHVAFIEIESAPKLLGFNLYRSKDGGEFVRVNPEGQYIEGLSYREDLTEPGAYVYKVEAVSEGDCSMMLDNVNTKLTIEPIGECVAPVSVKAVERAKSVRLDWDYQKVETGPGLVGFNVYRNGELLVERSIDRKYTDFNVGKGDYTYRVEAFYNNSCTASDSTPIKVTYEGVAMPPAHVTLTNAETAGNPQHYDVAATWELPYFETPLALGYCNIPYTGVTLKEAAPIYALIGWDSTQLEAYKDLYVVGIEYFIGEKVKKVEGRVYMNDTLVYTMPQPGRIREAGWNTLMFDRYFSMDQPKEFLVGYKVTYETDAVSVAVFDYGPGKQGYGDLISGDGKTWITLAQNRINANWCINALVVDKRDLEEAAASVASAAGRPAVEPVVKTMSLSAALALTEPKAVSTAAVKSSGETVKLQGFNVYRNGEKVNESLLSSFAYTDAAVPAGEYDYEISAVYSGGEEVKSEAIYVELGKVANLPETLAESVRVFPNPARLYFRVEGDYTVLEINNLGGKTLRRYTDGRHEIDATGLKAGLYVLRFTLADGTRRLQKIVLE